MYPVTTIFEQALRGPHTAVIRVDITYNGTVVAADIDIADGSVRCTASRGVRRVLDLTVTDRDLWGTLAPIGTELVPYRGVRYPSGVQELVPLGVFRVDAHSMSVAPGGGITIRSAPDRWAMVQKARFETPRASTAGARAVDEVGDLVAEAVPTAGVTMSATSSATVGAMVYDRDRDRIITELLTAAGADAYFDNAGDLVVADQPLLGQAPAWTVDASETGGLLDGSRGRDRSRTYNVVVVNVATLDGEAPPTPVIVEDDDPTSQTYVSGPMGRVPYFWTSPLSLDATQMTDAGTKILNRVKGTNAQLDLTAAVHPGLEPGDVIEVVTIDGTVEWHQVTDCTIPLSVGGTQSIATQSSRPDGDVPAGE